MKSGLVDRHAPPGLEAPVDPRLAARYARLAFLFDQAFRIPGTPWRIGIEPIIGLVPGIGDAAGALLGAYGVWVAYRVGAPLSIHVRMLLNLAVDALAGSVPIVGDIFDVGFKAHMRNRRLLERWAGSADARQPTGWLSLVALFAGLLMIGLTTLALTVGAFRLVVNWVS